MNAKQMCVANLSYKNPSDSDSAGSLMRYLTFREGRDEQARQIEGEDRWIDKGMGNRIAEVIRQCQYLQSDHVLLFSLVINPNPELLAMVEHDLREQFVKELTENVVEELFKERGVDTGVEFSYVTHHRMSTDLQNPGLHDPHTHVVLPGTYFDANKHCRVPLYFSRNERVNHIEMLHRVTEQQMAQHMEQYVGKDWEQRMDALLDIREQQREVTQDEPQAMLQDAEGREFGVWCGVRSESESTSAFGYYCEVPAPTKDNPKAVDIQFRPLIQHLDHREAQQHMEVFNQLPERFREFVSTQSGMAVRDYEPTIEEQRQSPSLDISL